MKERLPWFWKQDNVCKISSPSPSLPLFVKTNPCCSAVSSIAELFVPFAVKPRHQIQPVWTPAHCFFMFINVAPEMLAFLAMILQHFGCTQRDMKCFCHL